jgi:putative pyruvate formate lyase activating enzyme
VYLPDLKFYSSALSKRYLGKENYFDVASEAVRFMAQKPLKMTKEGKLLSGTIVRHLVMPLCASDSKRVLRWIKEELPPTVFISLMSQYTPFGEIEKFPELARRITAREYDGVVQEAFGLGLENRLFAQERSSSGEQFIPEWDF